MHQITRPITDAPKQFRGLTWYILRFGSAKTFRAVCHGLTDFVLWLPAQATSSSICHSLLSIHTPLLYGYLIVGCSENQIPALHQAVAALHSQFKVVELLHDGENVVTCTSAWLEHLKVSSTSKTLSNQLTLLGHSFTPGTPIVIPHGPFSGYTGTIKDIGRGTMLIEIEVSSVSYYIKILNMSIFFGAHHA